MTKAKQFLCIALTLFLGLLVVKGMRKEDSFGKPLEIRLVQEEKPFVILIPSYNNEEYVGRNLTSVLDQEYTNYRVIFIDDCSTDDTGKEAVKCVEGLQALDKVTFIHNEANYKALYNVYYAIQALA